MPAKTPSFWYEQKDWRSCLLSPIAMLYQLGHCINYTSKKPFKAGMPVICVGNIVMGGSGKTPTVQALLKLIEKNNIAHNPVVLTRGYGGNRTKPTVVDCSKHSASDIGDEALLLAEHGTVIVSPDRKAGAEKAKEIGADLIIMDDGFQNNTLHKDFSLLVVDALNPFGNGSTFPSGPLREPIEKALKRTDAVISINGEVALGTTTLSASIKPITDNLDLEKNYDAFAGLGRPEKFLNTLEALNINVTSWHEFADHHPYTHEELDAPIKEANDCNASLITTEKDLMRIAENHKAKIQTLPIELSFGEEDALVSLMKEKVGAC